MTNGLYTTAVGMVPQMYKQEVIANNLANVNTTGYKKDGMLFQKVLDANLFTQLQNGDFNFEPDVQDNVRDFKQGPFVPTGSNFDVAIEGDGFFVVETPQGMALTRNGNFTLDADGRLVSNAGYPVVGEDGYIEIDEKTSDFQISEDGEIFVNKSRANKFLIQTVTDKQGLEKFGDSLFRPKNPNVEVTQMDQYRIQQGYLEQSNVNPVEEMVNMLITMRQFEAMQKTVNFHNETLGKAVNELGRVA
ncbi:flagellar basal-body rod protein FlgF [candidate division KSB1 bacterium]|nr:flagellar basal-body rod protein FlgF [candidate division KSB1 bacterium]